VLDDVADLLGVEPEVIGTSTLPKPLTP